MENYEQKLALLSDMIAFAIVDGELHDREYQFLSIVAVELGINKTELNQLFHEEKRSEIIKSEFERIQQFYRLALLMHSDGVLHTKEDHAIQQITLNMGLNPLATKRILKIMKKGTNPIINPELLLQIFKEQHN